MSRLLQPRTSLPSAMIRSVRAHATPTCSFNTSHKTLETSASGTTASCGISPSQGEDRDLLVSQTTALVDRGLWKLCNDGKGLERAFKFKTFKATWDFMNAVAAECKKQKHHPEWSNIFNKTYIRWTTHKPEGLSGKDTAMARFCDEAGRQFGESEAGEEVASCHGPPGSEIEGSEKQG